MYWITGILGLALGMAPFLFGYSNNQAALWTSLLIGGATLVVSWAEGIQHDRESWEYWTAITLGIVAIVAPFIFGFVQHATAMWTTIIVGALITLFAGTKLAGGSQKHHYG